MQAWRLLDLFCGAGGAGEGYRRAGFDVTGVDLNRNILRHNPGDTILGDAMEILRDPATLRHYDVIHASPPCQAYSITRHTHGVQYPDLLGEVLDLLREWGGTWVVENVPGAPLPGATTLCGSHFRLRAHDPASGLELHLRRHRLFLASVPLSAPGPCVHDGPVGGVYGGGSSDRNHALQVRRGGYTPATPVRQGLMGIDWMPLRALSQAIPPAYTEWVGNQLMRKEP